METSESTCFTFHTCSGEPRRTLLSQAEAVLREAGSEGAAVALRRHRQAALESRRSLEALVDEFEGGDIVFDSTGVVSRGSKIVGLATSLRRGLGANVAAVAFEPRRRTLYMVMSDRHPRDIAALRTSLRRAGEIVHGWRQGARPDFDLAIRVGFGLPHASRVVAVDRRSVISSKLENLRRRAARTAAALGLATVFGAGAAATASADPAVSQPNVTVITKAGDYDGDFASDIGAKLTMPLGESLGFHVEGQAGTDGYVGLGGELFWRDPNFGLLGAYVTHENLDNIDMTRVAEEAELYLDQVTLGIIGGYQSGDVEDSAFGRVDIRFYATPDFVLRAGGEILPGIDLARIGAEWRPGFEALSGLSIFADGEYGDDYTAAMMGLRLHFGGTGTTLIDRDRREDPSGKLGSRPVMKKGYSYSPCPAFSQVSVC